MSSNDNGSSEGASDFFALPPFKAEEALVKLRRDLRELKSLAEKGTGQPIRFEWKAMPVSELSVDEEGPEGKPAITAAMSGSVSRARCCRASFGQRPPPCASQKSAAASSRDG